MSTAEESLFTTHAEFTSQWIYEEAVAWRETVRGWDNLDAIYRLFNDLRGFHKVRRLNNAHQFQQIDGMSRARWTSKVVI